jgi:hypothetical protein
MVAQITISGTSLEFFSRQECVTPGSNMVFWRPDGQSFMLQAKYFQKKKKPCGKLEIDILGCVGMILYGGCLEWGLNRKCQSFVRDPSFSLALYTSQHFSQFPQTIDHSLCAHWTAGFTARPPDIGSTKCNTIFHVSSWAAVAKLFSTVVEHRGTVPCTVPLSRGT